MHWSNFQKRKPAGSSEGGQFTDEGRIVFSAREAAGLTLRLENPDQLSGRDFAARTGSELAKEWDPDPSTIALHNQEERATMTKEEIVQALLMHWTSSSGGPVADAIVMGAIEKAGLSPGGLLTGEAGDWMRAHPQFYSDFKKLGVLMYEKTQKWFKDQGISKVGLYRKAMSPAIRSFSSWSSTYGGFITTDTTLKSFERTFPVSRILSVPMTGFGNIIEHEVVVIGDEP